MSLGMEVGLRPGDFVLDGDPTPPPKKAAERPSQFLAHVYCDQTAGWRWALVQATLWYTRTHLPPQKGGGAPSQIFGPFLLWPNRWLNQDATCYGGRSRPRRLCVSWGLPPQTGRRVPSPTFGLCLFWPNGWMDQDGTSHGPGHIVLDGTQLPSSRKKAAALATLC